MSSATMSGSRSAAQEAVHDEHGLSLAVADVGWFNTENLFREIDRESVDVLLLKCYDYLNGWRRGFTPGRGSAGCGGAGTRPGNSSSSCRAAG